MSRPATNTAVAPQLPLRSDPEPLRNLQLSFYTFLVNVTYPWTEVDNPVELHQYAGFAVLEAELLVLDAGAGSQLGPGEAAGLPDADVALQVAPVLVVCRLVWGGGRVLHVIDPNSCPKHHKQDVSDATNHQLEEKKLTSTILKLHLVALVVFIVLDQELLQGLGVRQESLQVIQAEGHFRLL